MLRLQRGSCSSGGGGSEGIRTRCREVCSVNVSQASRLRMRVASEEREQLRKALALERGSKMRALDNDSAALAAGVNAVLQNGCVLPLPVDTKAGAMKL